MSYKVAAPFFHVKMDERRGAILRGTASHRLGQVNLPQSIQTDHDVYSEWQWDGSRVVVRNCRLGFTPIFYYATHNEFCVAQSVDLLLECGASAELDDTAVAVFLRLGFLVGEDTVFRNIRAVPPGGEISWGGGNPKVIGEYYIPRRQNISRIAAIEGYGELFRQAVQRRTSDDVHFGLPLSGGRDSRHILLEMNALGYRPDECYTTHDFPPYRKENIRFAALLCEQLNIRQYVIGQPGSRLAAELSKNRATSFGALEHTWAMAFYRGIARHTSIVYDGIAGDVLSAGYQLRREHTDLYERGRLTELAECLFDNWQAQPGYEDALRRILTMEAAHRFSRDVAVERLTRELSRHTSAANPLSSFYFWNRTRRGVSLIPFSILPDAGVAAVTPFLDHDLIDYLASLPTEMFIDKTFHTDTIRHMHPEFNNIPYAENREPITEDNTHYRRFLAEACGYLAIRGKGALIRKGSTVRRLLALALMNRRNLRMRMSWVAPFTALYMTQLEQLEHNSLR